MKKLKLTIILVTLLLSTISATAQTDLHESYASPTYTIPHLYMEMDSLIGSNAVQEYSRTYYSKFVKRTYVDPATSESRTEDYFTFFRLDVDVLVIVDLDEALPLPIARLSLEKVGRNPNLRIWTAQIKDRPITYQFFVFSGELVSVSVWRTDFHENENTGAILHH